MTDSSPEIPSVEDIRNKTIASFGKRPCLWQVRVTQAFLKGSQDIVCIAGTSMGKTLTFWMPLLFRPKALQIIVTPLNQLGKQQVNCLEGVGLRAIAINADTASEENYKDIEALEYRAIIISPEQMMKPGGMFEALLKKKEFVNQIMGIIFDEAHCITTWGAFRPEYRELGRLRFILPHRVPYMITSATLTPENLADITRTLSLQGKDDRVNIQIHTDRPNIRICIRKIKHPFTSYADLFFLVPEGWMTGDPAPPKFLVFFDDIQDAIAAAKTLQKRLPHEVRHRIKWFNSDMTTTYKEAEVAHLHSGDTWGLCTTESFGMGMDVPDIAIVVQWRATCGLSTLWQRWGRAARAHGESGTAILFAEKDLFDDVKEERRIRQETRKKRTGDSLDLVLQGLPKRLALGLDNTTTKDDGHNNHENGLGLPISETALRGLMVTGLPGQVNEGTSVMKRWKKDLEPAMDYLINANFRGVMCRRVIVGTFFGGDPDKGVGEPSIRGTRVEG
ncbi:P-loop containing nucleoside triphosphate hydrolase protein [Pisolithus albus]|nr:P-loop containing nucleoside triphosphate hydrolase protein [Pisolithus albus]